MNRSICVIIVGVIMMAGCKNSDSGTSTETVPPGSNYFPFEVGRSWTYNTSGTLPNGNMDPRSTHTLLAKVFQMNQTIGGQPNATIIQATDERNQTTNFVCYAEPTRFWAYFSAASNPSSYVQWIYFDPGYPTSATIGVNETAKYYIYDWYGGGNFEIRQQPNINVAAASILNGDTLVIQGSSVGMTTLMLGAVGSPDSMEVIINVVNRMNGYGPVITPWMPIWQASLSTSEVDLYKWDSTFSFKKLNGTTLRDHIVYHVTSKFVKYESVSAAGGNVNAEKHLVQITVTETIDSISGGITIPMFDGLSYQMTADLWMAAGIGFVRGDISGSAITGGRWGFATNISGYTDQSGIFQGYFQSPRLSYWNYNWGGGWYEWFGCQTQIPPPTGAYSFVLASKNF